MKAQLLIVDDEPSLREMLARHFRFLGYQVQTACDGVDALEKMSTQRVDVVISDIMMPNMNGVELLEQIRAEYPMTRAIMITGYVTLENAMAAMRHNADTCIFKPLEDLTLLETAVESAVHYIQHWIDLLKELQGMKVAAVD